MLISLAEVKPSLPGSKASFCGMVRARIWLIGSTKSPCQMPWEIQKEPGQKQPEKVQKEEKRAPRKTLVIQIEGMEEKVEGRLYESRWDYSTYVPDKFTALSENWFTLRRA